MNMISLGQCPKPHWIGDGACDDLTNIAECDFDGNDCCQDNSSFSFCQICACLESNVTTTTVNEGSTAKVTTELDSTFESTTTDNDAGISTTKSQTNFETTSNDLQTTSEPTNE